MSQSKKRRLHGCACASCRQHPYSRVAQQHKAINRVLLTLDEKNRRRFVGLLAIQWGWRSVSLLSRITGLSRTTIRRGKTEIEHPAATSHGRIRALGGGRWRVEKNTPTCSTR